ncbi:hypothetical protein [Sanguibacter antarcticus]|uniref:DUF8094 domain-containing protein n=1 Tax=Sanguibacter antarcticus TaxID=372484 RepID=A0A2A9E1W9_9MICO|nr:hypothetical protein [Sanguibacter antarcticus]PFG32646.1 hypothetical protein ATL42_0487 [Sanguibacter antarcticus]
MRRHLRRSAVLVCTGALFLAACAPDLPTVDVTSAESEAPVVSADQEAAIHTSIGEALTAGTETLDAAVLAPRLTGPALALRTAELTVAAATDVKDAITEVPTVTQSEVVQATDGWPRWTFAVSERPLNLQTERLLVTEQESPREQYKLWGWIRLFPGVTLPTFPAATTGTEAVAADDASLLLSPVDAVAHYADVLNSGDESAFAAEFPSDPLRDQMTARRADRTALAETGAGTYTLVFTPTEGALRALRTTEGGALVIAEVTSSETLAGEDGAVINPTATESAFTGGAAPSNSLTVGRTALVGIYVPAAGSTEPITVVGSELLTTSASVP